MKGYRRSRPSALHLRAQPVLKLVHRFGLPISRLHQIEVRARPEGAVEDLPQPARLDVGRDEGAGRHSDALSGDCSFDRVRCL